MQSFPLRSGGNPFDLNAGGLILPEAGRIEIIGGFTTGSTSGFVLATGTDAAKFKAVGGIFEIHAVMVESQDLTTLSKIVVGYNDNGVGINNTSSGTNPKRKSGDVTLQTITGGGNPPSYMPTRIVPFRFDIPEDKYPYIQGTTGIECMVTFWGYQK